MVDESPKYLNTEERRQEIAAAARALILEKGLEGLRTRAVASRVGINISTLHYHVPTKKALVELVAETLRKEFEAQDADILRDGMSPLEELKLLIDDCKQVILYKPQMLDLMDALGHRAGFDEGIAASISQMRRHWISLFGQNLQRGKLTGDFRSSLDPEAAAHMIAGAIMSFHYKPRRLLPLFDSVANEIIRSVIAD